MAEGNIIIGRLPRAPEEYDRANEDNTRRIIELAFKKAGHGGGDGGGDTSGLPKRRVHRLITGTLDEITGLVTGSFDLPGTAGSVLLQMKSRAPGWFCLYGSEVDRVLDVARTIDQTPTTPIIIDANFVNSNPTGTVLSRTAWVVGPGCSNPGTFASSIDGSQTTKWSVGVSQAAGQMYSVDFGSVVILRTVVLDTVLDSRAFPNFLSIEVSTDGAVWAMQEAAIRGDQLLTVTFPANIATRYMRFVITQPSATDPTNPWSVVEFNAYSASEDFLDLRMRDGDVDGVLSFNRDDLARATLYYRFIGDPLVQAAVYTAASFARGKCCIWSGGCIGPPDQYCDGKEPQWALGVTWFGINDLVRPEYRWRYHQNFEELRWITGNGIIARFTNPVADMQGLRFKSSVSRDANIEQSQSFSAMVCGYLNNSATLGAWDTLPHIKGGLVRDGDGTVKASVVWRNAASSELTLGTGPPFALGLGASCTITGGIYTMGTALPRFKIYINTVLQLDVEVPVELTRLAATHNRAGFYGSNSAPPAAPLGYGGLALVDLYVYELPRATIDVGFVPIERPGGSIIYGRL